MWREHISEAQDKQAVHEHEMDIIQQQRMQRVEQSVQHEAHVQDEK